jgi:hypothetical protein
VGLRPDRIGAVIVVVLAQCVAVSAPALAQPATRRLATIESLRQFPGFFHLQNVLVRGEFKQEADKTALASEEGSIRAVLENGVRTTSGPVEVRAQLVDVGRLEAGDPRVPDGAARDASRWPRPGEELVLRVTNVTEATPPASPSVRALALEPSRYQGQKITITGNFRGRNLFGDLPGTPGKSRYDFVLRGAEGAVWVTGMQPRGRGFDLDIDRRVDTDQWLEVTGVVSYERGLVQIEATELLAAKPPTQLRESDERAAPPPSLPPLEVVFSTPTPGEADVPTGTLVRIQFSRALDQKTVPGAVRVRYSSGDGMPPPFKTTYDGATRALALRFAGPLERGRTVLVEVVNTLKAFDGGVAVPWSLTFTVEE